MASAEVLGAVASAEAEEEEFNLQRGKLMGKFIIALDEGTTSARAGVYDVEKGVFVHRAQQEVGQSFPHSGWVEQDANEIYYKVMYVLNDCIQAVGADNVAAIGIANQRETVVFWNRETGEPVCPAIVWQCRRTGKFCASIDAEMRNKIKEKTGLLPDAYFSASKIKWNLDNIPVARKLQSEGKLCAGTVESFIIFRLTGLFLTDYTNASRTMLFDIRKMQWDKELCDYFGIPLDILPKPVPSDSLFGTAVLSGKHIPVAGVLGDQQAALFGQACYREGDGKITYGTGLFMLFHTGEKCIFSDSGLLTTVGYTLNGKTAYALEGSAFNAGSAVQWLRDGLGIIKSSAESEELARSVESSGGVSFVPAFTGLGAPHWNSEARGLLSGISRGTTRAHIVRAVLESIAFTARDLADCMIRDSGINLREIKCDGGASANSFLMQFQADVLGIGVNRPVERESTLLGVALLAAVSLGLLGADELENRRVAEKIFVPSPDREQFDRLYNEYLLAVKRALMAE